jgi:uncharacterized protein YuzE
MIRAEYDREADALYVRFSDAAVAETVEVDDYRIVDLDADGRPVGLEVLYPATNLRIGKLASDFGFSDRLTEIDAVVAEALGEFPAHRVALSIRFVIPDTYPAFAPQVTVRSSDSSAPRPLTLA